MPFFPLRGRNAGRPAQAANRTNRLSLGVGAMRVWCAIPASPKKNRMTSRAKGQKSHKFCLLLLPVLAC